MKNGTKFRAPATGRMQGTLTDLEKTVGRAYGGEVNPFIAHFMFELTFRFPNEEIYNLDPLS